MPARMFEVFALETGAARSRASSKSSSAARNSASARKYRASCDGCSLSKVKCDKNRPSCHRCADLGITCNYSPSLRRGKRPASKHGIDSPATVSPMAACHSSSDQLSHASTLTHRRASEFESMSIPWQEPTLLADMEGSDGTPEPSRSPSTIFPGSGNLLAQSATEAEQAGLAMDVDPAGNVQISPSALPGQLVGSADELQSYLNMSELDRVAAETFGGPFAPPLGSGLSYSFPHHDCTILAFSTLHSLHLPSTMCGSAAGAASSKLVSPLPTIDQVLTTNQTAIKHAFTLLDCSCSRDRHLPLLISVIGSKILAWYQAIMRATTSTYASSSSSSSPSAGFFGAASISSASSSSTTTETVVHTPITWGAYKLDGEEEKKMKVQVVLGELRKVGKLVERFSERFCPKGAATTTTTTAVKGEPGSTEFERDREFLLSLESFLRTRMRETVQETMEEFKSQKNHTGTASAAAAAAAASCVAALSASAGASAGAGVAGAGGVS